MTKFPIIMVFRKNIMKNKGFSEKSVILRGKYHDAMTGQRYISPEIINSNVKHFREGKEEGLREGVEKGILQVAQNMKAAGMSIETIATMTGLTIEEIEKL